MGASTLIRVWVALSVCAAFLMLGCTNIGETGTNEEPLVDTDGDGLFDSFEEQIGTDPTLEDTDEDGYLDGDEWYAFSDPLDAEDFDYLDGEGNVIWSHHAYPADLVGTGTTMGEVATQFSLPDYWVQQVNLYSLYGNVIQIVSTADS